MFYLHKKEFDFAIRICAYLAGTDLTMPISVNTISKKLLITNPFATKIIYSLRNSGILNSKQGKFGGIFLNVNPAKLTLYKILESVGLNQSISSCITKHDFCPLPAPCKIHSYFLNLENELLEELKKKKLSELAFSDKEFKLLTNK